VGGRERLRRGLGVLLEHVPGVLVPELGAVVMQRGRDPYSRSSFAAKRAHHRRLAGWRPSVLYRCRLCAVKVLGRDREGHLARSHSGGDVLVCFAVVRKRS